jgi:hypothetical protein
MTMAESPNAKGGGKTGALDPNEKWGQGTDASHPISAAGGVEPETPTVDTTASEGTLLDDGEMTDMVDRLRESGDATVDRVENDQDIALEDVEPA